MIDSTASAPLSIGDIVSRGIRQFRLNYGFYYYVFTITALLINLPIYVIHWCFRALVEDVRAHGLSIAILYFSVGILVGILALLVGQFQVAIRNTAVLRMSALPPMQYAEAFKYAKDRQWQAFGLHYLCGVSMFFLVFVSVGFAVIAAVILSQSHVILMAALIAIDVIVTLWVMTWLAVFVQLIYAVFACEDLPFADVIKRAAHLTTPNIWRGSIFVAVLFLVMIALKIACDFPVAIGNGIYLALEGFKNPNVLMTPSNSPVISSLQLAGHVWESVTLVVSLSVSAITTAFFYTDVRQKLEGQDILNKVAKIEGTNAIAPL